MTGPPHLDRSLMGCGVLGTPHAVYRDQLHSGEPKLRPKGESGVLRQAQPAIGVDSR
jgi:hypothetical protein